MRDYRKLAFGEYGFEKQCENCKSLEKICVHHKDHDRENNSKENLQILCRRCHIEVHKISSLTKIRLSKALLGKYKSKEHCKKIGLAKKGNKYCLGKKHTKESRIKISLNHGRYWKGKKLTKEHKEKISKNNFNNTKVNQYDLDGNFIKTWDNIINAGINHIGDVCLGKRKTAGGFIWKYFNN